MEDELLSIMLFLFNLMLSMGRIMATSLIILLLEITGNLELRSYAALNITYYVDVMLFTSFLTAIPRTSRINTPQPVVEHTN